MNSWTQFTHKQMHQHLLDRALSDTYRSAPQVGAQALFCPYYVPLEGRLGADWGVIVNPVSSRFGALTFEHDDCGCPPSPLEDTEGWGRHTNAPNQDGDMWAADWVHVCTPGWCDEPCSDAA